MALKFASFNRRVISGLIDTVVLFVGFMLVGLTTWILPSFLEGILALVMLVAAFLYTPLMCFKYQATVGMKLCKTKMVDENGNPPTLKQSLLRAVIELPFALFLGGFGTVIYMMFMLDYHKSRQLLADTYAKTRIIEAE